LINKYSLHTAKYNPKDKHIPMRNNMDIRNRNYSTKKIFNKDIYSDDKVGITPTSVKNNNNPFQIPSLKEGTTIVPIVRIVQTYGALNNEHPDYEPNHGI
jgi:hypothetical protein